MSELDPRLVGEPFVNLVRCSTDEQEHASIPDQLQVLNAFAERAGMIHAGDDFILPGVSGSHPGARTDIDKIIQRKRTRNDFTVLLVQDLSRLTRGGVEHGGAIEFALAKEGIRLVFAANHLPVGDHAGIVKSVEYYAAQQYARSVSFTSARGHMSAILDGRHAHCLRPPYGVDRLYVDSAGKPLHIVRNLPNGTQQKFDPNTRAVLQTYPKPIKGEEPIRCRKQSGERIILIPGADEFVEIVRRMFRRALIDGWGDWRIAKELIDEGVLSPGGKAKWSRQSVKMILRNPIYVGRGIANRYSMARYHERSKNAPTKLPYDLVDAAQRGAPPRRIRPKNEWVEQHHPQMENFLGDELRELAIAYQARYLTDRTSPRSLRKDKHVDSSFILKGMLKSKQGGHPMTGRISGANDIRYYNVKYASFSRAATSCTKPHVGSALAYSGCW